MGAVLQRRANLEFVYMDDCAVAGVITVKTVLTITRWTLKESKLPLNFQMVPR